MINNRKIDLTPPKHSKRLIAGCMTGTSIDGIDAALVEIEGFGLEMRVRVLDCVSQPLDGIGESLRQLAEQKPMPAGEVAFVSRELAQLHLAILRKMATEISLDLVAVHGQTVYHSPPLSWQLIDPTHVACALEVPVVYNLRAADLAHGGQGAPITPIADFIMFRNRGERRCIVNLGGFCNITLIQGWPKWAEEHNNLKAWAASLSGQDVCSCNNLLDLLARELLNLPFDRTGSIAMRGEVQPEAFKALSRMLEKQAEAKRSLGTGDELGSWVEEHRDKNSPEDLARTACASIAALISRPGPLDRRILSGGGVKNLALLNETKSRSRVPVNLSDDFGIPASYREAIAIAILGALSWDRHPITLPRITGSIEQFVSGSWILP